MTPEVLTALIGIAGALFGAIGGYYAKRAEKAPDQQATLNAAVANIVGHYTAALKQAGDQIAALREEVANLRATIADQGDIIGELEHHIDALTTAMGEAGVQAPPRKRRAAI